MPRRHNTLNVRKNAGGSKLGLQPKPKLGMLYTPRTKVVSLLMNKINELMFKMKEKLIASEEIRF